MLFETLRLYARRLNTQDLAAFHDLQGNPTVMQYTTGRPLSRKENQADLQKVIQAYQKEEEEFWVWACILKRDLDMIGTVALVRNDEGEMEIGYRIRQKYWSRGYGTEMTEGLIQHAFEKAGMPVLHAYVVRENQASIRVLEKVGFQFMKEYWNEEFSCWDRIYRLTNPKRNSNRSAPPGS